MSATKGDTEIELQIGGKSFKNKIPVYLDVPAKVVDGRTLVPLRFVSESMGCTVGWDAPTQTINIFKEFDLGSLFHPSGWMGDGASGIQFLSLRNESSLMEGKDIIAIRIEYQQGPKGWTGIYWQYPDGNWGEKPGFNLSGAKRISFYAKGERGGEIVEFKAGGISSGKYKDTFMKSTGKQKLTNNWKKYEIDLSQEDLTNVIGAFAWVVAGSDNGGHAITYISKLTVAIFSGK